MMTTFKILLLTICTVLCFTVVTVAGIDDVNSHIRPTKLTIYGHTGQDPVYKSTGSKDGNYVPTKPNPKLHAFVIEDDALSNLANTVIDIASIGFSETVETANDAISQSNWNALEESMAGFSSQNSGGLGEAIPAPSAMIVLISGLLIGTKRRR